MLVVLEHLLMPLLTRSGASVTSWVNPGRMGVIIFFAVSGFVIPLSIRKSTGWKDFLLGRFFRLYPAYWMSLFAHFLLWKLGSGSVSLQDADSAISWIVNLSMLQMFFGFKNINLVAWTLGLEWVIYVVALVMILIRSKFNATRFLWTATISLSTLSVLVPLVMHKRIPVAAPQCLIAALFGYAVLLAFDNLLSKSAWTLYAWFNIIFQMLAATVNYKLFPKAAAEIPFVAIVFSVLLAYAGFLALYRYRSFKFPEFLVWVGKISYSVYLFHGLVIYFCVRAIPGIGGIILSIGLTILLSALLYSVIEVPFQRIGSRLRKKVTPPISG
jgi:peptidoglycan/LPS O-acetylase OafA/YrhL